MKNAFLSFLCFGGLVTPIVAAADQYPLHTAIKEGKPSRVRAEIRFDRLNTRNGSDMTPLMVAAMYDRSTSAQLLIDAGAAVNATTSSYGTSALMMAAMNGYHEVVEVILKSAVDINARNKSGFTALMLAAQKGHTRVVQQLLQAGADPQLTDASNRTALTHAANDEVRRLLESTPQTGSGRSNYTGSAGSAHVVQLPFSGKSLSIPMEFWSQVADINARLEKALGAREYEYMLACQAFWWQEYKRIQNCTDSDDFSGLCSIKEEHETVYQFIQKLRNIADNPAEFKNTWLPHWEQRTQQGIREREYVTDITERFEHFDVHTFAGYCNNDGAKYSFWDARTGRLINRLNCEEGVGSAEYADGGTFRFEMYGETCSLPFPFLGEYTASFDGYDNMFHNFFVNPYTQHITWPFYERLGLENFGRAFGGDVSSDVARESDWQGWLQGGASYLQMPYFYVYSTTSTGSMLPAFQIEPQFYIRGTGNSFSAMEKNGTAFSLDFSRLVFRKTKTEAPIHWISPAWGMKKEYPAQIAAGNPILGDIDSSLLNTLLRDKTANVIIDNDSYERELNDLSIPVTDEEAAVYLMSNWSYSRATAQIVWGDWLLCVRHDNKEYYVNPDLNMHPMPESRKLQFRNREEGCIPYWEHAIPLHLEKSADSKSARLLLSRKDKTCVYHIDFEKRKLTLEKEWPCANPNHQRAFYVKDMQLLAQPVSALKYELLRLNDSWETEPVADMYLNRHGEYAIVLPNGHYAGSPGCERMLELAEGDRVLGAEALAPWRNRPAEVLEYLGGNADDVEALRATTERWLRRMGYSSELMPAEPKIREFPVAEVAYPPLNTQIDSTEFEVSLYAAGKAITTLEVYADGTRIPQEWDDSLLVPAGKHQTVTVRIPLSVGQNWIELKAVDSTGIAGDVSRFRTIYRGTEASELYVVTLGVSDYKDDSLDLQYAAKDAEDIATQFSTTEAHKVHTLSLTNKQVTKGGALKKVKNFLATSKAHDRVVFYIAGHGMLDNKLDYYYAPYGFDAERVAKTGISLDALVNCLNQAPARRRMLLLDTCHAGMLGEEEAEKLALAGVELPAGVRAVNKRGMKVKRTKVLNNAAQKKRYMEDMFSTGNLYRGVHIIAASSAAEYAFESGEWKNGIFATAIMQTLRHMKEADEYTDAKLSSAELSNSIISRVDRLTSGAQKASALSTEDGMAHFIYAFHKDLDAAFQAKSAREFNRQAIYNGTVSWELLPMERINAQQATALMLYYGEDMPKDIFEQLLQKGANRDIALNAAARAFYAQWTLNEDLFNIAIENGADVNKLAVMPRWESGDFDIRHDAAYLKLLLSHGYDIKKHGSKWLHSLMLCYNMTSQNEYIQERLGMLRTLVNRGIDINVRDEKGRTPLHTLMQSFSREDEQLLTEMIRLGADPDTTDDSGRRAIEPDEPNYTWLQNLVARAKGQNVVTGHRTPLHTAVEQGKPSAVRAALSNKSHLEARDEQDRTPLMIAAMKDRSTSAELLLEAGADVNAASEAYGTTVLMMAAMNGYDEVVAVLLRHSPRLNERNKSGFSALMLAARGGHITVVQQLLNAGANKYQEDYSGRRAADHATNPNIKKLLSL